MSTHDEWAELLVGVGSHERPGLLLEAYHATHSGELTDDEMRHLVAEWWTACEAWGELLDDALEMFEVLGPVGEPPREDGPWDRLTVYRATGGVRPDGGSWTLDRAVAERFAEMIRSGRGAFLGIYSQTPVVWRAEVAWAGVLGYFTDRNEAEVVLSHGAVKNAEPCET